MKTSVSTMLLLTVALGSASSLATGVPTAVFHGLGDSCRHRGMKNFADRIADQTGAISKCVEIGSGSATSIFENFEKQAESACASILADEDFQGEFNVLGLSQGGLIARYIVE